MTGHDWIFIKDDAGLLTGEIVCRGCGLRGYVPREECDLKPNRPMHPIPEGSNKGG